MRHVILPLFLGTVLLAQAGCGRIWPGRDAGPAAIPASETDPRPAHRPAGDEVPPAETARTAEEFDTTSAEDRAAAIAEPEPEGEALLGSTVATLGSPTKPGFWLETPLVSTDGPGRVVAVATGKSVQLDLVPIGGAEGAGSRISLPALRLLGLPLAGLHELGVYAR